MHEIRTFAESSPTAAILTEPQWRVFAMLTPDGELELFASKQRGTILQRQLAPGVANATFSLRGDALLLERVGSWQVLRIDNPWPELAGAAFGRKSGTKTIPRLTGSSSPPTPQTAIRPNSTLCR